VTAGERPAGSWADADGRPASEAVSDPDRPFVIGLTGPIGCGKSTVARMLGRLGALVIDADAEARAVTGPGEPTLTPIRARFGGGVFAADGKLDRGALAREVFSDAAALRDLEAIVHPAVRRRLEAALEGEAAHEAPFVVVEAIKLVEGGLAARCDEVWLVDCDAAAQRERLAARGMATDDIERRLATQGDLADRLAPAATRRIDTSGAVEETRRRVEDALADALADPLLTLPVQSADPPA
jgi:dephospho-CoA kinase